MGTTILTDIEGTTSSISFVKDVLFPFARRALPGVVRAHGREPDSYRLIADSLNRRPGGVVFLSDVVAELDAAREAGMRTVLLDRREDYPQPRDAAAANGHPRVESFDAVDPLLTA
jgi:methionine salvage enolase-phosphatase E1